VSEPLARLGEVDWAALGAPELPDRLRAVASADRGDALAALEEVRARVWHEGTVYEPAAPLVPFLVELARAPEVLVRPPLLQLLAFVFTGEPPPEHALGRAWVDAARLAVRRSLHDLLALVEDPDRDVRIAAAALVTGFRDRAAEPDVRRALERRAAMEEDEVVRANLLGCLSVYLPSTHHELHDRALTGDASLLVRREAAHSLAAMLREEAPTLVAATLLEAILHAAELEPLYAGVAWNRRGVVADSCWALTRLGDGARAYLRYLEKLLGRALAQDALAIAEAALLIAFGAPAASRARGDLAPDQLALLHTLSATDAIWGQELPRMLAYYGLPREQRLLAAFAQQS
jgi:hypothetical protein